MPSALSSREVVWMATPSQTYRTGKTNAADAIAPSLGTLSIIMMVQTSCRPVACVVLRLCARARLESQARSLANGQKAGSEDVGGQLGQRAPLALGERDVARQALEFEFVDDVHEA